MIELNEGERAYLTRILSHRLESYWLNRDRILTKYGPTADLTITDAKIARNSGLLKKLEESPDQ